MDRLLLVQVPPALTQRIRQELPGALVEDTPGSDEIDRRLARRGRDLDAVIVGPGGGGSVKVVERAASADPDLAVVMLCWPEERNGLLDSLRFSPFPGRDVRCITISSEEPLAGTLHNAVQRTRQRRSHRATLAAVQPTTRPLHRLPVSPTVFLDRLLDHAPIGVLALGPERRVAAWNRKASEILERAEATAIDSRLEDLLPGPAGAQLTELVARARTGGEVDDPAIIERTRSDGSAQHLEVSVSSLIDLQGAPGVLCSVVDISERRRAEAALRRSERRYRSVVHTAASVIVCLDTAHRIVEWNPAAERLYGWQRDEVLGKNYLETFVRDEARELVAADIRKVLSGVPTTGFENAVRTRDGETRVFIWNVERLLDANDRPSGIVAVGHDVTHRKRNERLLRDKTLELERSNRELEEFTTVASHDLQEPLRKLVSFSALLREDLGSELPPDAERDLELISDGATRMQKLVRDLLALSRAGQLDMLRERVSVDVCVARALEALALLVRETGAKIECDALPELRADATLLTEIYQNLIGNALKFVADDRPLIRLTAEWEESGWVLGVKDNGIGLSPEDAGEVFKPFRKLHGQASYPGSGIGLTICRKAVERHDGRIWIASEPGRGAHIRFTLGEASEDEGLAKP